MKARGTILRMMREAYREAARHDLEDTDRGYAYGVAMGLQWALGGTDWRPLDGYPKRAAETLDSESTAENTKSMLLNPKDSEG